MLLVVMELQPLAREAPLVPLAHMGVDVLLMALLLKFLENSRRVLITSELSHSLPQLNPEVVVFAHLEPTIAGG